MDNQIRGYSVSQDFWNCVLILFLFLWGLCFSYFKIKKNRWRTSFSLLHKAVFHLRHKWKYVEILHSVYWLHKAVWKMYSLNLFFNLFFFSRKGKKKVIVEMLLDFFKSLKLNCRDAQRCFKHLPSGWPQGSTWLPRKS